MKSLEKTIKILFRDKKVIKEIAAIETSEKEYREQLALAEKEMFFKGLYQSKDYQTLLQLRSEIADGYFHVRIAKKEEINNEIVFQDWKDFKITKEFLEDQYKKVK